MEITNLDAPPIFDPLNPENCQCDKTVLCLNFPFFVPSQLIDGQVL